MQDMTPEEVRRLWLNVPHSGAPGEPAERVAVPKIVAHQGVTE